MRVNLKLRQWDSVWSTISRFFTVGQDGRISQRRLLYELERAREMRTRRSSAGLTGAAARWAAVDGIDAAEVTRLSQMNRSQRLAEARRKGKHTEDEWIALVEEFDRRCVRCGRAQEWPVRDHILPIFAGGSDAITNIQPLCQGCNGAKGVEFTNWCAIRRAEGFGAPAERLAKRLDDAHPPSPPKPEEKEKIPPKAPPRGAVRVKELREPDYPEPFERIWAGCDRVGTKAHALKAWRQVGEPAPEVVIPSWAGWKRIAWPDGIGVQHVATWLRAFNWRETPAPPVRGNGGGPAAPSNRSALEAYCDWHKQVINAGKASRHPKPTCPECKHTAARDRDRTSDGPVPIGALGDEMPGWSR